MFAKLLACIICMAIVAAGARVAGLSSAASAADCNALVDTLVAAMRQAPP